MHAFAHAFPADDMTRDAFELTSRTSVHRGATLQFTCRHGGAPAEAVPAAVGGPDPQPARPRAR